MVCQICGEKSGFFPICKNCNTRKEKGEVSKCQDCGIWKEGDKPLCYDCFLKNKKINQKEAKDYIKTDNEKEEDDFRNKFPATYITEDGHRVRSKSEQIIDNWLYHKGIVHAYERKVPIEEDVYCDFFIPLGQKVWIEYWGADEEKYLKRKELKKNFYAKYKKNLIELNDKDIEKIDDIMPKKLRPFLPDTFSFD
jgi:hypothetical protein